MGMPRYDIDSQQVKELYFVNGLTMREIAGQLGCSVCCVQFRLKDCNPVRKKVLMRDGYRLLYMPEHPRAHRDGRIFEHILIAERALGKPLPVDAEIHHHGRRDDNKKIVICQDKGYHHLLHARVRLLWKERMGGKVCNKCGFLKPFQQFYRSRAEFDGWDRICKECSTKRARGKS